MSSEDQQQGNRYSPDCLPISRASSHLRVEDRNIVDVFAADLNAIHNGSEVETRFNNDESGFPPHYNHEESGSDQSSLRDVFPEFTNSNPALSINNAVENDNELENFSGGNRPQFLENVNVQQFINHFGDGRYQETENSSEWFNPRQEKVSSSSPMLSLETQVAPESSKRPRLKNSISAISEHAEEAQLEPSSLAVRKSQRHRTRTDEQAKEAQPEPSSLAVKKSQRHRTPTDEQAKEAQPEPSSLAVRKLQRHRIPTDEQAKEAQPEPSSLAVRKPQRHRTPTDEQAEEAQSEPSSLAVRKSQRHRTPTQKYDSSVEDRKTPRRSRRKKVSTSADGESTPTAEEELKLRELQAWINPMLDQLWQWTTPALNDVENGPTYYKRCFTGTPETPNLSFKLGDAIELMGPESSKYIGIVAELFQRHRREEDRYRFRYLDQRVHTVWLYLISDIPKKLAEDTRDKLRKKGLNLESALFISQHSDVNALQKVRHTVKLLSVEEYSLTNTSLLSVEENSASTSRRDSNEYYLAGFYDSFWNKVYLELRGNFSLPEFLRYDSLKQQALMGNSFIMPTIPAEDWCKSAD